MAVSSSLLVCWIIRYNDLSAQWNQWICSRDVTITLILLTFGAVSLRSSFFSTKYTSLGANLNPISFSEIAPICICSKKFYLGNDSSNVRGNCSSRIYAELWPKNRSFLFTYLLIHSLIHLIIYTTGEHGTVSADVSPGVLPAAREVYFLQDYVHGRATLTWTYSEPRTITRLQATPVPLTLPPALDATTYINENMKVGPRSVV